MAKAHRLLNPAQLERRRAAEAKKKLWDRLWLAVMIAALVGIIAFNIYIQMIHHP